MIPKKPLIGQKTAILSSITAIAVPALIAGGVFAAYNFSNETVDGGYAAYVYSKPIFGAKEFKQVLRGPGGTGMVWRQDSFIVSVTPYTMSEQFTDIRAADQLKMTAEAYLVFRIDANKVKEFVEQYGAMSEVSSSDPEAIVTDAYQSFIQQPFRTAVRSAIARFSGLDAPAHLSDITVMVTNDLKTQLAKTPFILESVTIGSTTPPESVTAGITKKVEATQEYERQAIELEIAKRSEEIANAEGRAKANRVSEEARGNLLRVQAEADAERYKQEQMAQAELAQKKAQAEGLLMIKKAEVEGMLLEAKGRQALGDSITDSFIRLEAVKNFDKLKFPHIVVGSEIISPIQNILQKALPAMPTPPAPPVGQ
ncbi:MAG: SPFH domain-containing protein [Akkermansia sp.]